MFKKPPSTVCVPNYNCCYINGRVSISPKMKQKQKHVYSVLIEQRWSVSPMMFLLLLYFCYWEDFSLCPDKCCYWNKKYR